MNGLRDLGDCARVVDGAVVARRRRSSLVVRRGGRAHVEPTQLGERGCAMPVRSSAAPWRIVRPTAQSAHHLGFVRAVRAAVELEALPRLRHQGRCQLVGNVKPVGSTARLDGAGGPPPEARRRRGAPREGRDGALPSAPSDRAGARRSDDDGCRGCRCLRELLRLVQTTPAASTAHAACVPEAVEVECVDPVTRGCKLRPDLVQTKLGSRNPPTSTIGVPFVPHWRYAVRTPSAATNLPAPELPHRDVRHRRRRVVGDRRRRQDDDERDDGGDDPSDDPHRANMPGWRPAPPQSRRSPPRCSERRGPRRAAFREPLSVSRA